MDLHDSVAVVKAPTAGSAEFATAAPARRQEGDATARPEGVRTPGVTTLGLDITDLDSVAGRPRSPATSRSPQQCLNNNPHEPDRGRTRRYRAGDKTNFYARSALHARSRRSWRQNAAGRSSTSFGDSWLQSPRAGADAAAKAAAWR